ncbi:COG0388 Predicted amidohydrolase [Burkholderiaceae bacterium]
MTSKRVQEALIKVACVQMEPIIGKKQENLEKSRLLIEEAARMGARLIILPELANTGYVFETRAEAFVQAEEIPSGESSNFWSQLAIRLGVTIVVGIAEREQDRLFNSAIVTGPKGFIGKFRKVHLWGEENLFFEPGNLGFPIFHTPLGRIGVMICYDGWFPESYRLLAMQGADIVCVPTNWIPLSGQDPSREAMANILAMASAHSNSLFVAAANRVGTERGQPFIGQSLIVSHTGWPVAGPASFKEEEIIIAEINLSDARRKRNWNAFNQVLRDRRNDVYDEMLGTQINPGWY